MDYEINLNSLGSKQKALNTMSTNVETINSEFLDGYLSQIKQTEVGPILTKLTNGLTRLNKGYKNSNSWFQRYVTGMTELEEKLSNTSNTVTKFTGEFMDIFTKVTIPYIQTNSDAVTVGTIDALKAAFLGDVDDPSQYTVASNYRNMVKHMRLFDNTTGEEIPEDGHITIKKGEVRIITVKLPTNTGMIDEIHRTSASGDDATLSRTIVSTYSDIDPDPNTIERVNYKYSIHWPTNRSLLHANHYDWIIIGTGTGTVDASQTCEYTNSACRNWHAKAMVGLKITVVDE